MSQVNRPTSPHLQIYKPQLTAILSITHRATGVFLTFGMPVLVYWLYCLATSEQDFNAINGVIGSFIGRTLLLGWTFSLFYHLANGIRHLFWDAGMGFEMDNLYASGKAVVVVSVVLTLASWLIGYNIGG